MQREEEAIQFSSSIPEMKLDQDRLYLLQENGAIF